MEKFVRKFLAFAASIWPMVLTYVVVGAVVAFGVLYHPAAKAGTSEACYTVGENIGYLYDSVQRAPDGTDFTPTVKKIVDSSLPDPQKVTLVVGLKIMLGNGSNQQPKQQMQAEGTVFCEMVEKEQANGKL